MDNYLLYVNTFILTLLAFIWSGTGWANIFFKLVFIMGALANILTVAQVHASEEIVEDDWNLILVYDDESQSVITGYNSLAHCEADAMLNIGQEVVMTYCEVAE